MHESYTRKIINISLVVLLFVGCTSGTESAKSDIHDSLVELNIESAINFIEIAKNISTGKPVVQQRWDELFTSSGYQNYLVYSDSTQKKELIREAIIMVFDNSKKEILDSLLTLPVALGKNFMKLSVIKNFKELKDKLDIASHFLLDTDFSLVLARADSLAQNFLPPSVKNSLPDLYPVFIVASDPDGKVINKSIILDLNLMLEMSELELVKFIAHEYHHAYRKIATSEFEDPLMIQLDKLNQEAIADLIDKEKPPVSKLGLFPEFILVAYNTDYQNTPKNLKLLDSLVTGFSKGKIDTTQYEKSIKSLFKFGGHTTGIYMSFLINETIGKSKLIECYNDPVEFISLYNKVASRLKNEYIFSKDFIDHLIELTIQDPIQTN